MSNLLVIAAWEPELVRFRALGFEDLSSRLTWSGEGAPPLNIITEPVGVGLVDATLGVTRCITRHCPSQVVLLGTAGAAHGSNLRVGDVIVGRDVRLVDAASIEGRAAMVMEETQQVIALDAALRDAFVASGARAASIANTLGITTDDALAARLAPHGEVEHLESYGVARACQQAQPTPIPCAIILGIANIVGAKGREEWRTNHVTASAKAAEVAMAGITRLSQQS